MARYLVIPRVLGLLLVAHGLMLLGADEISTIENGGVRTIRSLVAILTLYRADPTPFLASLPDALSGALQAALSLPGWGVLFLVGGFLAFFARDRNP
jgi:hypothetical protein